MTRPPGLGLGQPPGFTVLLATTVGEAFSIIGMQALLALYVAGHILQPTVWPHVLGFGALRAALQAIYGHCTLEP